MSDDERGAAARQMIAEDARWVADAMISAQDVPASGVLPFVFIGHASRIVYEGSHALRSTNPGLGIPVLARLLPSEHDDVIARARHATKLLDDTEMSFEDLRSTMATFHDLHNRRFTHNSTWIARALERDLGLFDVSGRLISATIPLQYRVGLRETVPIDQVGATMFEVARSLGGALMVLGAARGDGSAPVRRPPIARLGRSDPGIGWRTDTWRDATTRRFPSPSSSSC